MLKTKCKKCGNTIYGIDTKDYTCYRCIDEEITNKIIGDREYKKKRIIEIIKDYAELRYNEAIENDHWAGVDENENEELINFIKFI